MHRSGYTRYLAKHICTLKGGMPNVISPKLRKMNRHYSYTKSDSDNSFPPEKLNDLPM